MKNISNEKYIYNSFRRENTVYLKANLASDSTVKLSELELPNNSCLHTLDQLMNITDDAPPLLDASNPLISNESYIVHIKHTLEAADKEDINFPITDRYRLIPSMFKGRINNFHKSLPTIRKMTSPSVSLGRINILNVFNYNPLLTALVVGKLFYVRKMDIVIRSILSSITKINKSYPDKYHHIYVPLSSNIFNKAHYLRAFKKLDASTVKIKDDPSFLFLVHFIGMLTDKSSTSLFDKLPESALNKLHVIFSVDNENAIIYNIGDILKITKTAPNVYINVMRQINILKLKSISIVDDTALLSDTEIKNIIDEHAVDNEDPEIIENEENELIKDSVYVKANEPMDIVKNVDKDIPLIDFKSEQETFDEVFVREANNKLFNAENNISEKQLDVAIDRINNINFLEINGKSIGGLLNDDIVRPVHDRDLTPALETLNIPDKSMMKSSVMDMDSLYIKNGLSKDIAKVAVSLATSGLILQKVEEVDEINEFNRIRKYIFTYRAVDGKRHTVVAKLPIINSNGIITINGINSRMVKQQANLPICKISEVRVNLSSNFNKTLIERSAQMAHSFSVHIHKYIHKLISANIVNITYGENKTKVNLPYDYSCVGEKYTTLNINNYNLIFNYEKRFNTILDKSLIDSLKKKENKLKAVYCGTSGKNKVFYSFNNLIKTISPSGEEVYVETIRSLLSRFSKDSVPAPKLNSEWTELKIQDKSFPISFILGYRFGLTDVLKNMKHPNRFIPNGTRAKIGLDEISISFSDGKFIFPRYPLKSGLILSGLSKFKLNDYAFSQMDEKDIYYDMLSQNNLSINYLKGIDSFFELFVDPMTRDVLIKMNEPTTVKGLLYRATEMLSTKFSKPAASMANHRTRGYERFPAIMYNEMARELARFLSSKTAKKTYSINPEKVLMSIVKDESMQVVEEINPVHDLKLQSQVTYAGTGGRTSRSFVITDRKYPDDAVGILSEATPDSGKVALNAYMPADPILNNDRGMYDMDKAGSDKLEPNNVLSVASMLMPGSTQDDAKRMSFTNIQLSHHVPCQNGETGRIRTGYEAVVPHLTGETFACVAKEDGKVLSVDNELKLIKIQYISKLPKPTKDIKINKSSTSVKNDFIDNKSIFICKGIKSKKDYIQNTFVTINKIKLFKISEISIVNNNINTLPNLEYMSDKEKKELIKSDKLLYIKLTPVKENPSDSIDVFKFGDNYTNISGSYLRQQIVLNVKEKDSVKKGDIIAYNSGFFEPDPDSKQITWKHGVTANVALMSRAETLEDSCEISKSLSKELYMSPGHARVMTMTNDTVIRDVVKEETVVETTDYLLSMEDGDLDALSSIDDPETMEMLADLNRKTPRAKYHGKIAEIEIYHSCEYKELTPSLQKLAKRFANKKNNIYNATKDTIKSDKYYAPSKVPVGTKYKGVDFLDDTIVAIIITISEDINCIPGDKLVIGAQAKTVIGSIMEKQAMSESGLPIDIFFDVASMANRILISPFIMGIGNKVVKQLEEDIIKEYFK